MAIQAPGRPWIIFICILVLISLGLLVAVIYLAATSDDSDEVDDVEAFLRIRDSMQIDWSRQDLHFVSQNGSIELVIPMCAGDNVTHTDSASDGQVDSLDTTRNSTAFTNISCQAQVILHGCCESNVISQRLTRANLLNGTPVPVVQTSKIQQWFYVETCLEEDGCFDCECHSTWVHTKAVVRIKRKNRVRMIKYLGCCKCLNVGKMKKYLRQPKP